MAETTLGDVILSYIKQEKKELYTTLPATIQDVSNLQSQNAVSVLPAVNKIDSLRDYEFPILQDVPVQWPAGGGSVITFPLKEGDDVIVVFSMLPTAEFQSSEEGTVVPFDSRTHNLADCYVIPSIFRDANNPEPNPDDFEIKYNNSKVIIQEDGTIEIVNEFGSYKINADGTHQGVTSSTFSMSNGGVELVDILSQALSEISNATVNTVYGASPLNNKPAIDVLIAQLDTLKE